MKTKSIMFKGWCGGCNSGNNAPFRGGLRVQLEKDSDIDDGEMVCLDCAEKLARRLKKRVKECRGNMALGLVYRNDAWEVPAESNLRKVPADSP